VVAWCKPNYYWTIIWPLFDIDGQEILDLLLRIACLFQRPLSASRAARHGLLSRSPIHINTNVYRGTRSRDSFRILFSIEAKLQRKKTKVNLLPIKKIPVTAEVRRSFSHSHVNRTSIYLSAIAISIYDTRYRIGLLSRPTDHRGVEYSSRVRHKADSSSFRKAIMLLLFRSFFISQPNIWKTAVLHAVV